MKTHIVGLLAGVLLCTATAAYSDPVTVISGFIDSDLVSTSVNLTTDTFSVEMFGKGGPDGLPILRMPALTGGYHLGDTVDFSATVIGRLYNFRSVIDGVTYPSQGDLVAAANLQLNATPVVVTANDPSTSFTLSGSLQVFKNNGTLLNPEQGDSVLFANVAGRGTLEANGVSDGPIFRFEATNPSPTPEPASLLLLGTGGVGLLYRRFRRA